jgi:hypothetical protein
MKMLGWRSKEDVRSGLHGWSAAVLTIGLGMSSQEVEILLMEVKNDINSNWLHAYILMYVLPMAFGDGGANTQQFHYIWQETYASSHF